jgi:CubicO group peptidase (beta-lactamase class C family)
MRQFLALALLALIGCSDSSDRSPTPEPPPEPPEPVLPEYDFSTVDERLQQFLDDSERYDGISITLVDRTQGTVHEQSLGDHTTDIVVMLASTSKVPSVSLLMALDEDPNLDFDIAASIDNYLPWDGVYGDRTTVQLVSNTSGIPGLNSLAEYGVHLCQFSPDVQLQDCAQLLYSVELPSTVPAGTTFDYGGSQWQLAGAVAEQVSNSSWRQAFDQYIAGPCELEVMQYGNNIADPTTWTGSPDSMIGLDNPLVEGGAISNLQDYAKYLLMHLRDGQCGDNQVLSSDALAFMRVDRAAEFGTNYGMGWWIEVPEDGSEPTLFWDPGAFGSISWIDTERQIGGFVAIDDYTTFGSGEPIGLVLNDIIPLVEQAVDEARAAVSQ